MDCKHLNVKAGQTKVRYMGGLKGTEATYSCTICKDCGKIVKFGRWPKSSKVILSQWGESIIGKHVDKSTLTSTHHDILHEDFRDLRFHHGEPGPVFCHKNIDN